MKKLLLLITTFTLFLMAGCQEVNDLIKIQQANSDINEIQIDMEIDSETEVDVNITEEFGFDPNLELGMNVSMQVSNGVIHSYSTVDVFGLTIGMEQYSLVEGEHRVVYTNIWDVWTKEYAEESEMMNLYFDAGEFLKALNGSFNLVDPITVTDEEGNEKELQQMELTMTVEDVENIFGLDYTDADLTEEELAEMLATEITFTLGYTRDTYLIERVTLDLTELYPVETEGVEVVRFDVIFEFSKHNDIGEITLPVEALMTDFTN